MERLGKHRGPRNKQSEYGVRVGDKLGGQAEEGPRETIENERGRGGRPNSKGQRMGVRQRGVGTANAGRDAKSPGLRRTETEKKSRIA